MSKLTSEERILEGVGIENTETKARSHCETALILVEAYVIDGF
jgi:hypothetical protein